ncbi:MAG: hypothetical protein AAGJ93_02590 [Bacteroidota bacterium]
MRKLITYHKDLAILISDKQKMARHSGLCKTFFAQDQIKRVIKGGGYFLPKPLYAGLALILLAGVLSACGEQKTDVSLRLTHAEKVRIDSIYTHRLDSLRPVWDSLCEARHDVVLKAAIDSIVEERLEEEARLRARFSN